MNTRDNISKVTSAKFLTPEFFTVRAFNTCSPNTSVPTQGVIQLSLIGVQKDRTDPSPASEPVTLFYCQSIAPTTLPKPEEHHTYDALAAAIDDVDEEIHPQHGIVALPADAIATSVSYESESGEEVGNDWLVPLNMTIAYWLNGESTTKPFLTTMAFKHGSLRAFSQSMGHITDDGDGQSSGSRIKRSFMELADFPGTPSRFGAFFVGNRLEWTLDLLIGRDIRDGRALADLMTGNLILFPSQPAGSEYLVEAVRTIDKGIFTRELAQDIDSNHYFLMDYPTLYDAGWDGTTKPIDWLAAHKTVGVGVARTDHTSPWYRLYSTYTHMNISLPYIITRVALDVTTLPTIDDILEFDEHGMASIKKGAVGMVTLIGNNVEEDDDGSEAKTLVERLSQNGVDVRLEEIDPDDVLRTKSAETPEPEMDPDMAEYLRQLITRSK